MCWIPVRIPGVPFTNLIPFFIEHIKYPDPKNSSANKTRTPNSGSQSQIPINGSGAISPPVSSDTDDGKRVVVSPVAGLRSKQLNGNQTQPFSNPAAANPSSKRPPTRPQRDERGAEDLAMVRSGGSDAEAQDPRNKMRSPENVIRPKTPPTQRPWSPTAMAIGRGPNAARSPSPVVPPDAFTRPSQVNGHRPERGSPAVGRPGSTSNITADLVQNLRQMEADLRNRDAEVETLRKRETWMRAALSKASKAGFSWSDIPVDDDDATSHEPETTEARKLIDLAFRLKQERATLQVGFTRTPTC